MLTRRLPVPAEMQHDLLLLHAVGGGKHLEGLGQVVLQLLAQEPDPCDVRQGEAGDARGRVEGQEVAGHGLLGARSATCRVSTPTMAPVTLFPPVSSPPPARPASA